MLCIVSDGPPPAFLLNDVGSNLKVRIAEIRELIPRASAAAEQKESSRHLECCKQALALKIVALRPVGVQTENTSENSV